MLGPVSTVFCASFTLAMSQRAIVAALADRKHARMRVRDVAKRWARTMCRACGVEVRVVERSEEIFREPLVIVANHQSFFDIPVLYVAFPEAYGMLAKKELFAVPFFGRAMRSLGCVPIDRSRRTDGFAAIAEAAELVRGGNTIVVFPEGSRSRDGKLRRLKKGPFHLAQMADVPILPVGIRGTEKVLPRGSAFVKPGVVHVEIGRPIRVGEGAEGREEARRRVRDELLRLKGERAPRG